MKYLLLVIFAGFTVIVSAQTEIRIEDAGKHAGDSIKIFSKIYGGEYLGEKDGKPTILSVGNSLQDPQLAIIIWGDTRKFFKKAPEEYYRGVLVSIIGTIQIFDSKPVIIVSNPNQIQDVIIDKFELSFPM